LFKIVNAAVEDGSGVGWIDHDLTPVILRNLKGDNRQTSAIAVRQGEIFEKLTR
jgi:hypothetical protein